MARARHPPGDHEPRGEEIAELLRTPPTPLGPAFETSAEAPLPTRAAYNLQRVFECVPAIMLALAVVIPLLLTVFSPVVAYIALTAFMIVWALRSVSMAVRQAYEFFRMRRFAAIDWDVRLAALTDPYERLSQLAARGRLSKTDTEEQVALLNWVHSGPDVPSPDDVYHLVVLPVANEDPEIITQTLDALLET